MVPTRRQFLVQGAAVASALSQVQATPPSSLPSFQNDNSSLQKVYDAAVAQVRSNIRTVNNYASPVLIEGGVYGGIWLECGPLEGAVFSFIDPAVALANHDIFFHFQRDDGYLPCWVRPQGPGSAQIQMVVPIAETAFDLWEQTRDLQFLQRAYNACAKWDDWLAKYRDTRKTGLCEAFCEYDTGHDNSPRFHGLPKKCPNDDARVCPDSDRLPYVAPDLSATVYGGRIALARIARALERPDEARLWDTKAARTRGEIMKRLYVPEDGCFYDLDATGKFVRIRGDLLTRVLGEHVVDQKTFDVIYRKQIHNPKSFWAPYPFPSIALDDPTFVPPANRNSWGGPSQALTALRASRWMEHYGKYADLAHLMSQWVRAITANGGFLQQMDPRTGAFTQDRGGYSPAALVLFDFAWRLHGLRSAGETLEWNCRVPDGAAHCTSSITVNGSIATLENSRDASILTIDGRRIAEVRGTGRVITDLHGRPRRAIGTSAEMVDMKLATRTIRLAPDASVVL
jgi:hypothetical protein